MKRSQEKGVKSKTKCPPEAAAAEEEDDEDECNICFEDLADTVLWPCMHRLCRTCGTGIATRKVSHLPQPHHRNLASILPNSHGWPLDLCCFVYHQVFILRMFGLYTADLSRSCAEFAADKFARIYREHNLTRRIECRNRHRLGRPHQRQQILLCSARSAARKCKISSTKRRLSTQARRKRTPAQTHAECKREPRVEHRFPRRTTHLVWRTEGSLRRMARMARMALTHSTRRSTTSTLRRSILRITTSIRQSRPAAAG